MGQSQSTYCCQCGKPRTCWWTVVQVPGRGQLAGWMCAACRRAFGRS
ncbi:MAG: hypothetical protein H0V70_22990 [Ktedonobacteraceae bacterium]|nr:hypothetical protein [Ktedonobacteraceae bacterium]